MVALPSSMTAMYGIGSAFGLGGDGGDRHRQGRCGIDGGSPARRDEQRQRQRAPAASADGAKAGRAWPTLFHSESGAAARRHATSRAALDLYRWAAGTSAGEPPR